MKYIGVFLFIVLLSFCVFFKYELMQKEEEIIQLKTTIELHKENITRLEETLRKQNITIEEYKNNVKEFEKEIDDLNEKIVSSEKYPENETVQGEKTGSELIEWLRKNASRL